MKSPSTEYAEKVVSGEYIANAHIRATCQRHLNDLKRKDISFDLESESRAIRFFEHILKLNGGQFEGKKFLLHASQKFIVGSLFAWKRKGGKRRFRRAYIEMGKGNGKSPLVAGIGIYAMIADGAPTSVPMFLMLQKKSWVFDHYCFMLMQDGIRIELLEILKNYVMV